MVKGILWDLDGTLLNTLQSLYQSGSLMLDDLSLPRQDADAYRYFAGDGAAVLVERALVAAGDLKLTRLQEGLALFRKYFPQWCDYEVKPYDGIVQTLRVLKEKGVHHAVLSNKPDEQTKAIIGRHFGKELFSCVRGQTEGVPKKPDPAGAKLVLGQLGLSAGDCLYVGDTAVDMQTGNAAGIFTVGAAWGFRPEKELMDAGARRIIHHPEELLAIAARR
ncbi:MAG: HAD family hydrolase [Christensenella sp.]|nr:HAD family hydrolase [Christensenella sp.]